MLDLWTVLAARWMGIDLPTAERVMTMTRPSCPLPDLEQPEVWSDENGNYWGIGHISPELFVTLCRAHDDKCGVDSREEGVDDGGLDPANIRHAWFRPTRPDDPECEDETRCAETHLQARPYTEWRR